MLSPGGSSLFSRARRTRCRPKALTSPWRDGGTRRALDQELKRYKEITGIEPFLEADSSADDVAESKPEPDVFKSALQKLGSIDPSEVLAVGDTPYDAETVGKTGISTVGVLCGGFSAKDLRD